MSRSTPQAATTMGTIRRRLGQKGQALVEFALLFPAFMVLLAGVADVGGLLDVHNAGIYAARQGARTGSVLGTAVAPGTANNNPAADCAIVGAVHSVLAHQPNMTVTQITIYKAGALPGSSTGIDEHYIGTADCQNGTIVDAGDPKKCPPTTLQCPSTSALPGSSWDPTKRIVAPYCEDTLGVKIDYTFQFQFNLIGSGPFPASDYAEFPLDPNPQAGCP